MLFNDCGSSSGIARFATSMGLSLFFLDVVGKVAEGLRRVRCEKGELKC
jgi:hypothetical protein